MRVVGPMTGEAIAARAQALVGVRFRAQGRSAAGLDCVGLVAAALGRDSVPGDYAMRGGSLDALVLELGRAGLAEVADLRAGDVMIVKAGPGQLHLGVWTGAALVHADAGLRRVVERPGAVPWPVVSVWRMPGGGEEERTPPLCCACSPLPANAEEDR